MSRGNGYTFFLGISDTVFLLEAQTGAVKSQTSNTQPAIVRLKFINANAATDLIGIDRLPGKSNYLIGNNPNKWHTEVPHYRSVRYEGIYPGVDLIFYGNRQHLEFDFVLSPGSDPTD